MTAPVFSLDPGTTQTGYVLYEDGIVGESGVMDNEAMLAKLQDFARWQPNVPMTLAIEMIASYGMAVGREVFETCVWIGRFQQAWHTPDDVQLVYRRIVKLHLCESAKAKDTNIWQALVDRFGEPGTKKAPGKLYGVRSHARAALALAVTVADIRAQAQACARGLEASHAA